MGGLNQGQRSVDTPLAVYILEAESSIKELQCCCQDFVKKILNPPTPVSEGTINNPVGAGIFCGRIGRGEFIPAMEFAQDRFDNAQNEEIGIFWLKMINGAKSGHFLNLVKNGELRIAKDFAIGQLHLCRNIHWQTEHIQISGLEEILWEFSHHWLAHLREMDQGKHLSVAI